MRGLGVARVLGLGAVAALVCLDLGAASAAAENRVDVPAEVVWKIVTYRGGQPAPASDSNAACQARVFVRFRSVPGADKYVGSVEDTGDPGFGPDGSYPAERYTFTLPPFTSDKPDPASAGPAFRAFDAPKGTHQYQVPRAGLTSVSSGGAAPCEAAEAYHRSEITDPRVQAFTSGPDLKAYVGRLPVRCQVDEIEARHSVGMVALHDCSNPAILGQPVAIRGTGFTPRRPVTLKWFAAIGESDAQFREPFRELRVTPDRRGHFHTRISADWLNGTCRTAVEATQGNKFSKVPVPYEPVLVVDNFGSALRLRGHEFRGGYLCADARDTNWPAAIWRNDLTPGHGFVAQDIPKELSTGPEVAGALTTNASLMYIYSNARGGHIDCFACTTHAATLEVQRPNRKFVMLANEGTNSFNHDKVWTFGGAPAIEPDDLIAGCHAYNWEQDQPVTWTAREGTSYECQQYPRSVFYADGLSMAARAHVIANGQIRVDHGLHMATDALLAAHTGLLLVQGSMEGDSAALDADLIVKLAY